MKNMKQYLTVSLFTMVTLTSAYAFDINSTDSNSSSLQDIAVATAVQGINDSAVTAPASENVTFDTSATSPTSSSPTLSLPTNNNATDTFQNSPAKTPSTKSTLNPTLPPFSFGDEDEDGFGDDDEDDDEDDD
jgi:hypothetical protein